MTDDRVNIGDSTRPHQGQATVGVLVDPTDRHITMLLKRFAELGWQVVDLNAYDMRLPRQLKLDGAILRCLPTELMVRQMLEQGIPLVRLGRFPHPDDALMPAVIPDDAAVGRLAAEHFAERGFAHVCFMGYVPWRGLEPMYIGFRDRAEELECHCHLLALDDRDLRAKVSPDRSFHDVQKQFVQDWWQTLPRPLGMLANGDMAAHRHCQSAMQVGLRVPEDLAILGVGNKALTCEGAPVPLSSIDSDEQAMLDIAIETLRRLMAGEALEKTTIHVAPRAVVTRRSTDVLAASDPHVVKSLRYMWDHIDDDLSVDQIVAQAPISRRALERAFKKDLGRGINAEIQRRRLEKSRELLLGTDWPVMQIAKALNFNSHKYFGDVFRNAYGLSPGRYRRAHQANG